MTSYFLPKQRTPLSTFLALFCLLGTAFVTIAGVQSYNEDLTLSTHVEGENIGHIEPTSDFTIPSPDFIILDGPSNSTSSLNKVDINNHGIPNTNSDHTAQCSPDIEPPTILDCPGNIILTAAYGECQVEVTSLSIPPNTPMALDQEEDYPAPYGKGTNVWQSFVPAASGKLVRAGFKSTNALSRDGFFKVYLGEGTGGTLLYSAPYTVPSSGWQYVDLPFFQAPILTAGVQYTINWTNVYALMGCCYPDGKSNPGYLYDDMTFRTYVQPLPPSASAIDNCSVPTVITSHTEGNFPSGTTTVNITATDAVGNQSTCNFDVIINDVEAPSIDCPENVVENAGSGSCEGSVNISAPVTNDNCAVASFSNNFNNTSDASGIYPFGETTIHWTVTDVNGNSNSCSHTVTIHENPALSITCPANVSVSATPATCGADVTVASLIIAGGTCAPLNIINDFNTSDNASGNYPIGVTTVTWDVTDQSGITATCSHDVTVTEEHSLSLTCGGPINKNVDPGICGADILVPVPMYSTGSGNLSCTTLTNSFNGTADASGIYPIGVTNLVWTLTHMSGDELSCTQLISINDNEAPVFDCSDIIIEVDASDCTDFVYSEQVGSMELDQEENYPAPFGKGTNVWQSFVPQKSGKLLRAGFESTNALPRVGEFKVFVGEGTGGTLLYSAPYTVPSSGWQYVDLSYLDAPDLTAGVQYTINWTNVYAKMGCCYPDGKSNPGYSYNDMNFRTYIHSLPNSVNSSPAAEIAMINAGATLNDNCNIATFTSTHMIGETLPVMPAGVTPTTWTATDESGNTSTCNFNIIAIGLKPVPDLSELTTVSGQCSASVNIPTATDNCFGTINGTTTDPISYSEQGTYTITWTYDSGNGNPSTQTQTVIVDDTVMPEIICPTNITVNNTPLQCGRTINYDPPIGTDNCSGAITELVTSGYESGAFFPVGTTFVTYRVTDIGSNSTDCNFSVTVIDNEPPVAHCPASIPEVILDANGNGVLPANIGDGSSTDNCTAVETSPEMVFSCTTGLQKTVTLTASDGPNSTSINCIVSLVDNTAPDAQCAPTFSAMLDPNGQYTLNPIDLDAGSTDACGMLSFTANPATFNCQNVGINTVTLMVDDGHGNSSTCTSEVELTFINNVSANVSHESCAGLSDGTITAFAAAPGGQVNYSIDGGTTFQFSGFFGNLPPGTYTVIIKVFGISPVCEETIGPLTIEAGYPPTTWYKDLDNDGYTDGIELSACEQPSGFIASPTPGIDCNDSDPNSFPGQLWYKDTDDDNYTDSNTQVACARPTGHKTAAELFNTTDIDCNDSDAAVNHNATEVCNGIDDNCNGEIDEGTTGGLTWVGNVIFTSQQQVDDWSICFSTIDGNVFIQGAAINDLSPLGNIEHIIGNLTIQSTNLTSLNGLGSLTDIDGNVSIYFNSQLSSLDGLDALNEVGGSYMMYFNFQLNDCCAIHGLVNGGGAPSPIVIFFNMVGCNSLAEINNNCSPAPPMAIGPISSTTIGQPMEINKDQLLLFPNPATHEVSVHLSRKAPTARLQLMDILGRIVFTQELEEGMEQLIIDLRNDLFENGVYLVTVQEDGEVRTGQFVIQQ